MKVIFRPHGKRVFLERGKTILYAARKACLPIEALCGGGGLCGKCKVRLPGKKVGVDSDSKRLLSEDEIRSGVRLACRVKVEEDMNVEVLSQHLIFGPKILLEGLNEKLGLKSNVAKYHLSLKKSPREDHRPYITRIREALRAIRIAEVDADALRRLPGILKEGDFSVTVILVGKKIVDFEAGDTTGKKFGIAFDVGTTTVVGYLLDLNTGEQIDASSLPNPQRVFGEDVVTRIQHATKSAGLHELNAKIIAGLNAITDELCIKNGIDKRYIYEAVVVGNACMMHLLLEVSPESLAFAPYVPVLGGPTNVLLPPLPARNVFVPPSIAGFMGADAVGCILASRPGKKIRLLLDVGTNCEVILGTGKRLLACSAAAGPAFEGAHIKHGMSALPGAITEVIIDEGVTVTTQDDSPPRGICGSGLVSALAAMLEKGIISSTGRMNDNHPLKERMKGKGGDFEFVLVEREGNQREITITQKDVREVQLAKGAIFSAQRILVKEYGIGFGDVNGLLLAGAFGTFLSRKAAQTIGMLPDIPSSKIKSVGNAAGMGAKMMLLSVDQRKEAEEVLQKIVYVELAGRKDFSSEFMDAMIFPHSNLELFPNVRKRLNLD